MQEKVSDSDRPHPDEAVVSRFQEQARFLAEWEWRRAEGFQQKAGFLLGGSGVVLALAIGSLDGVASWWLRIPVVLAVLAFLLAAVLAVVVLWPRKFTYGSHRQVQDQWREYTEKRELLPWQVSGLAVSTLLLPDGDRKASLTSLSEDATSRGRWFKWSVVCFVAGLFSIAVLALMIVVEGGTNV